LRTGENSKSTWSATPASKKKEKRKKQPKLSKTSKPSLDHDPIRLIHFVKHPRFQIPSHHKSQSSRPASLTRNFAPAAINEPVKTRTRPTSWTVPVPVPLISSTTDWDDKFSDDDFEEDVEPPITPPLSPLPAQNRGKAKRKLSIVDLTGDTPVSRSKRARKVESKEDGVDCDCKSDVKMKEETEDDCGNKGCTPSVQMWKGWFEGKEEGSAACLGLMSCYS
jgi:hypothetical protein